MVESCSQCMVKWRFFNSTFNNSGCSDFQVSSVWLTLAFTVDRYIMICHPFKSEPFCTVSRARRVVGALVASSIAFNLPKFFEYRTVVVRPPPAAIQLAAADDVAVVGCDLTEFGNSRVFKQLYHSWLYIVFVFGVPFVSLVVLNAFLVNAVRMSRQRSRNLRPPCRRNAPDLVASAPTYQLEGDGYLSTTRRFLKHIAGSSRHLVTEGSPTANCGGLDQSIPLNQMHGGGYHTTLGIPAYRPEDAGGFFKHRESSSRHLPREGSTTTFFGGPNPSTLEGDGYLRQTSVDLDGSVCQLKNEDSRNFFKPRSSSFCNLVREELPGTSDGQPAPSPTADSNHRGSALRRLLRNGPSTFGDRRSAAYQLEGGDHLRRCSPALSPAGSTLQLEGGPDSATAAEPRSPSPVTRRIDTTVMLIGVVVIFIVCQFPALVSRTVWAFAEDPSRAFTALPLYSLNETANFLVLLNSSVNFVPYYFFGRRFRRQLAALFGCSTRPPTSSSCWSRQGQRLRSRSFEKLGRALNVLCAPLVIIIKTLKFKFRLAGSSCSTYKL